MIPLSKKWLAELLTKPETGMDYQVVSIILNDNRRFDQVVVSGGYITQIKGLQGIPFTEQDIKSWLQN